MENYKHAVQEGQKLIFKFLKSRMKEKKITQKALAIKLELSEGTLVRYFKLETPMPLAVYLEICGILELRPYLIPAEDDQNRMERVFFN